MKTPWDFLTVAIFAGLIVLFLQRSDTDTPDHRPIWLYAIAVAGCAVTNYLGNGGNLVAALLALAATLGFTVRFLRPFEAWRGQ